MTYYDEIQEAAAFLRERFPHPIEVGIILGSGLGPLADAVEDAVKIDYKDIPHFAVSTVHGHAGQLVLGKLQGRTVGVLKGRLHFYEGYPMSQVTFPTRVLKALGAHSLVVTNSCGGLSPKLSVGDMLMIEDHIHTMPNPLLGPNDERLGLRFPQMAFAYDPDYRQLARETAKRLGYELQEGVYIGLTGPSFETPAEIRYFQRIGADAVGMSTTPEVIVASHARMRVLGLACVTNILHAGPCTDTHQDVLDAAHRTGPKMLHLVTEVLAQLPVPASHP